jgi:hypothetical protein
VLGLLVAFYVWTALTSADPSPGGTRIDPYNRQATAFLHGRLALLTPVPRSLLDLPDPYDPQQSLPVLPGDLRDLTLYHGRLYTYWGPVPALVAFTPFRLLGAGDLPPALALLAFAIAALLLQAALLRYLAARYVPAAPRALRLAALVAVGLGDAMPFLLRTPETYEVAIAAGACFTSAALYLFATGALGSAGPRPWHIAGGSLCAGLAFGSRPPMGIVVLVGVGAVAASWRSGALRAAGDRVGLAAAALVPFGACAGAVAAYNWLRFDSPLEFGLRYTLTGFDIHDGKLGHVSFLGPGLWYYLLQPLRPRVQFPFLWLGPPPYYPGPIPAAYEAPEKVAGIVWSLPFLLVLAAVPLLLRRRPRAATAAVGSAIACGLALMAFEAAYQPVATQRYEVDFLVFLAPAAAFTWLLVARRRLAWLAGALIAWSALVGVATSLVGYDDALRRHHAGTWSALESAFSPVADAAAALAGRPLVAAVDHDPVGPRPWHVLSADLDGAAFSVRDTPVAVQVVAAHAMTAEMTGRLTGPGLVVATAGATAGRRLAADGSFGVSVHLRGGRNEVVLRQARPGRRPTAVAGLRLRER